MKHEQFNDIASGIAAIAGIVAIAFSASNNERLGALEERTLFIESLFSSIEHLADDSNTSRVVMASHSLFEVVNDTKKEQEKNDLTRRIVIFLSDADIHSEYSSRPLDIFWSRCNEIGYHYCTNLISNSAEQNISVALTSLETAGIVEQEELLSKSSMPFSAEESEEVLAASAKPPESAVGLATVKIATDEKTNPQGWIYLGSTHEYYPAALDSNKLLTIYKNSLTAYNDDPSTSNFNEAELYYIPDPELDQTYKLKTDVQLRKSEPKGDPPGNFGEPIGILRSDSEVTIEDLKFRRIDPNQPQNCTDCRRAIWAKVTRIRRPNENNS